MDITLRQQYLDLIETKEFDSYQLPSLDRIEVLSSALFLGRTGESARSRVPKDRQTPYLPGLYSGTKEDEGLKTKLYEKLTELVPPSAIDDTGLCDYRAVPSDWSKLLTAMPGFQMKQATIPPISTQRLRESYHLTNVIEDIDRQIALEVLSLMTRDRAIHGLELSKKSSSSAPWYSKLPSLKKKEAIHGLTYKDQIAELVMLGQFEKLYKEFDRVAILANLVYRDQPDSWKDGAPKPREVTDLLYALTGGARGTRFVADKSIEGISLSRARKRTAFAVAGCVNKVLSALYQPFAKYAYSEFGFTWKTTSPSHLKSKMSDFNYYLGSDTTAHDQLYAPCIFDIFFEGMSKRLKPGAMTLLEKVIYAPYHMSSPYLGEDFEIWMGDPFDSRSFNTQLGLPSGLGPNSFIGRWWMTSFALMIIHRITGSVIGNVEAILKGRSSIGILNSADDMLFCFSKKQDQLRLLDAMNDDNPKTKARTIPPYMTMNLESPISFLGYVPYRAKSGSLEVTSNITSFVVNRLAPERGINSKARRYWALGFDAVLTQFGTSPCFSDVYPIFDDAIYQATGSRFERMIHEFGAPDMIKARMSSLSSADIEVLENPDKVYYKFDASDISKDVFDDITLTIPFETVEPLREDWYI